MNLYLIRHGKALEPEKDPEKSLSAEGRRETEIIAGLLKSKKINVSVVWHSTKTRAIQTARIIAKVISNGKTRERKDLNPMDSVEQLPIEIIESGKDIAIVGHLPFLNDLVSLLLTGTHNYELIDFQPSGVICLESRKGWHIQWVINPGLMK